MTKRQKISKDEPPKPRKTARVDGFNTDNGGLVFGKEIDWILGKNRRGKKQEPPLF